jgi:hypothetical protein
MQVLAAANRDLQVAEAFRAVGFMTAHPQSLASPVVITRALIANARTRSNQ